MVGGAKRRLAHYEDEEPVKVVVAEGEQRAAAGVAKWCRSGSRLAGLRQLLSFGGIFTVNSDAPAGNLREPQAKIDCSNKTPTPVLLLWLIVGLLGN